MTSCVAASCKSPRVAATALAGPASASTPAATGALKAAVARTAAAAKDAVVRILIVSSWYGAAPAALRRYFRKRTERLQASRIGGSWPFWRGYERWARIHLGRGRRVPVEARGNDERAETEIEQVGDGFLRVADP
jgi:hypothetical protein